MATDTSRQKIDPQIFPLLMEIKREIPLPTNLYQLSDGDIANYIVDEIERASNSLGISIYRTRNEFFISSDRLKEVHFPNKQSEIYLTWVSKHIGLDEDTIFTPSFRQQMFGRCWGRWNRTL
jgi:hypothetical protein